MVEVDRRLSDNTQLYHIRPVGKVITLSDSEKTDIIKKIKKGTRIELIREEAKRGWRRYHWKMYAKEIKYPSYSLKAKVISSLRETEVEAVKKYENDRWGKMVEVWLFTSGWIEYEERYK